MKLSDKVLKVRPSSTLAIGVIAKKMRKEGVDVVGFAAGEPDFNTPQYITDVAHKAIDDGYTKYTDAAGIVSLRQAIADKLKKDNDLPYDYEQIVVSNGAKHSLYNIFTAILDLDDEVILLAPYWLSYREMIQIVGGKSVVAQTDAKNGFMPTIEQLEQAISPKSKAIVLNSPNNPSGMVFEKEELIMVAEFAKKHDLIIISDEIYEKLIYDDEIKHISIASLSQDAYERTVIVNGLSKSHAMTGWRMGYTASCLELAKAMSNVQSHCTSNINSITQKASLAALTEDDGSIDKMIEAFRERRDAIHDRILNIPLLEALKPVGAFYLFIDFEKLIGVNYKGMVFETTVDIAKALLEDYRVAVVPCVDFAAPNYIRLSYAMSMANIMKGMDRIEAFITENFI